MSKMFDKFGREISRLRRRMGMDFLSFGKFYFQNYHGIPEGRFQIEISKMLVRLKTKRGSRLAIAAPRGFGKSTIVNLEYVIYCICYGLEEFIVIISNTNSQAIGFLRDIKTEFEKNDRLKGDFPEVCEVGKKLGPPRWSQDEIITSNNIKVIALGTGQQMRGRKHGANRPSLIILDDLETDESMQNPDSFHRLEDWLTKTVLKSGSPKTNVIYIGTLHHPASLLARFTDPKQAPGWTSRIYKAIISFAHRIDLWERWERIYLNLEPYNDEFGPDAAKKFYKKHKKAMLRGVKLLWPEYKSYYDLMMMRLQEGSSSFDCEMQNEPVNPRECYFNMDEVHYWDDNFDSEKHLLSSMKREILLYGACDPSLGKEGKYSDPSAIIVVAWNPERGKIYILEADIVKRTPYKTIEDIIAHHLKRGGSWLEIIKFGFETNQFQEVMAKELIIRSRERKVLIRLQEVKNTVDKIARIQSLQALIKSGVIQFSKKHTILLEQLRFFPKGLHDDGLDALEMVVRLCYKPPLRFRRINLD